jgi:hypothetical protein
MQLLRSQRKKNSLALKLENRDASEGKCSKSKSVKYLIFVGSLVPSYGERSYKIDSLPLLAVFR